MSTDKDQNVDADAKKKAYDKWLKNNRQDLNAKRRERYANDPEYRGQVLLRARLNNRKRTDRRKPLPDGVAMTLKEALDNIKLQDPEDKTHSSVIIGWSKNGLMPEIINHDGRYYLTKNQAVKLGVFLKAVKGRKQIFNASDIELSKAVSLLWSGW